MSAFTPEEYARFKAHYTPEAWERFERIVARKPKEKQDEWRRHVMLVGGWVDPEPGECGSIGLEEWMALPAVWDTAAPLGVP
jgi:hypothetical protein